MRRTIGTLAGLTLALHAVCAWAQEPPAERALRFVPDDAALVVIVPNVEALTQGLSGFGEAVAIRKLSNIRAEQILAAGDLLDTLDGLDPAGAFVLALSPRGSEPLVIATIRDADTWKRAAGCGETDCGLLRMPRSCGVCGFVAIQDGHLLVSDNPKMIKRALAAKGQMLTRFGPQIKTLLSEQQVILLTDVAPWRPIVDSMLTLAMGYVQLGMAVSQQRTDIAIDMWRWMIDELRGLVSELDVYCAGLRISREGIWFEDYASFVADGRVARYLRKVEPSGKPLLRGLPDGRPAIAFAAEWQVPPESGSLTVSMLRAMTKRHIDDPGKEELRLVMEKNCELSMQLTGTNGVFEYNQTGQGIISSGLYLTPTAEKTIDTVRACYELGPELMSGFMAGASAEAEHEVIQVGDTKVDRFGLSFSVDDPQLNRMFATMYGADPAIHTACHPDGVAYAFGPEQASRTEIERLLDPVEPRLLDNPRFAEALARLEVNPQFCVMVDLPRMFEFALQSARANGVPIPPVELKAAETKIAAWTAYMEPESVRSELWLPAEPVAEVMRNIQMLAGKAKGTRAGGTSVSPPRPPEPPKPPKP